MNIQVNKTLYTSVSVDDPHQTRARWETSQFTCGSNHVRWSVSASPGWSWRQSCGCILDSEGRCSPLCRCCSRKYLKKGLHRVEVVMLMVWAVIVYRKGYDKQRLWIKLVSFERWKIAYGIYGQITWLIYIFFFIFYFPHRHLNVV